MDFASTSPGSILALIIGLALAPFAAVMMTSFTKIVIVLSLLRSALGLQQTPPNVVINGLAAIICLVLIATAAHRLRLSLLATSVALGGFVLSPAIARWTTTAATEMAFTAMITAGVLWLALPGRHKSSPTIAEALLAGLLIGLSYYVRYAGLFLLVGLGATTVVAFLRSGRPQFRQYGVATLVSGAMMAEG